MGTLNQYFIQYLLKNGIVKEKQAQEFCRQINPDAPTNLKRLITNINKDIADHHLKIFLNNCEVSLDLMVVLLNMKSDKFSMMQQTFSPVQLDYFELVLAEIINSDNFCISYIVCLNLASSLNKSLSRDNGQKIFQKWLSAGYFVNDDGLIYLGIRTILEYASYLRTNCPDNVCKLCNELVFKSEVCPHCSSKFHGYCIEKYVTRQKKCSNCDADWVLANSEHKKQKASGSQNKSLDGEDSMEE